MVNNIHGVCGTEIHKQYTRQLNGIKTITTSPKQENKSDNTKSTNKYSDFLFGERIVNLCRSALNTKEMNLHKFSSTSQKSSQPRKWSNSDWTKNWRFKSRSY